MKIDKTLSSIQPRYWSLGCEKCDKYGKVLLLGGGNFTLLILMFGVMFLFLILPQQRRAKKERKFKNALKKGDLVVTKGGIHGKIIEVNDNNDTCVIETMASTYF